MRNNVAIRPLPNGMKSNQTQAENFKALLEATQNDENEARFWENHLKELQEKHKLLYRPGKDLFQIYYVQGKSNNANKQIISEITQCINKINHEWEQILSTFNSFTQYQNEELKIEFSKATKELEVLDQEREKFLKDESSKPNASLDEQNANLAEYLKTYAARRTEIQKAFEKDLHVKEVEKKKSAYLKKRKELLRTYTETKNPNFEKLLVDLSYTV